VSDRRDAGGINIHVPIRFEDGEKWILRIPSFGDRPQPADVVALVRTSEVLTYKSLRAAGVAVPEVYSWGFGDVSKSAGKYQNLNELMTRPMFFAHTLRETGRVPCTRPGRAFSTTAGSLHRHLCDTNDQDLGGQILSRWRSLSQQ
jgi:hypothetical protein